MTAISATKTKLLTPKEALELIGLPNIGIKELNLLVKNKRVPFVKEKGRLKFYEHELTEWVNSRKHSRAVNVFNLNGKRKWISLNMLVKRDPKKRARSTFIQLNFKKKLPSFKLGGNLFFLEY